MRLTNLFLPTLREAPSDADIISTKLMFRAGMIRKLASGIYEWLPLGLKVLKKVEQIIREEMDAIGGQEVWLPIMQPKDLWLQTGRWNVYGKELFRLKDRKDSEFCLGPTHEEIITDLVKDDVRSYKELPIMLYQFGIKFRDEIRPRFGVMRAREFYMKDAYSFHTDEKDAQRYYESVFNGYKKICDRCGFDYRVVEAATGNIGGSFSHEFMVLAETGEEEMVWCGCGFGSNIEKAECAKEDLELDINNQKPLEEVYTPDKRTVEEVADFLKANTENFIKTLVYILDNEPIIALIRGDYEINESKLRMLLNATNLSLADEQSIEKITGAPLGFAGPVGLANKNIKIIADFSVEHIINGISGANKKDYHLANICMGRDFFPTLVADIRKITKGEKCIKCGKHLNFCRGIEIGHTFKLGLKYSKPMKSTFLDAEGKENFMEMGCYGIGVSRIVAATIEQSNDENGIIWPVALAPYKVVIVPINWDEEKTRITSEKIYKLLLENGIDTLLDDRRERAGIKFKDADLIGIPYRITVSEKNLQNNKIEFKVRQDKQNQISLININDVVGEMRKKLGLN